MREVLFACLTLFAASGAFADSSWVNVRTGEVSASAAPNSVYLTTIDADGVSVPIVTLGCKATSVIGGSIGGTFIPQFCESGACSYPVNCHTSGAIAEGAGCTADTVAAVQVISATATDVIVLTCGGK